MTEDIEKLRMMCQRALQGLEQLLRTVASLRDAGVDATQIDIKVSSRFQAIFREYDSDYKTLTDKKSEPWYMDDLAGVLEDLDHADHVVGEERSGMYEFGWPWEKCIAEWTGTLKAVLERLSP